MVENLQLAHQELSVIIDLINTVSLSLIYFTEFSDFFEFSLVIIIMFRDLRCEFHRNYYDLNSNILDFCSGRINSELRT